MDANLILQTDFVMLS